MGKPNSVSVGRSNDNGNNPSTNITPNYWAQACAALSAADAVMARLIAQHPNDVLQSRGEAFSTLARSIVGQQISVKAAQSVWERFLALFDTTSDFAPHCSTGTALSPATVLQKTTNELRSAGLSARKAEYMHSLAEHFEQQLLSVDSWVDMPDDTIIAELIQIRGIGRWTAEMFLMFCLLRPNILPLDDIGLLKAVEQLYPEACHLPTPVAAHPQSAKRTSAQQRKHTAQVTQRLAQHWQPWCSVATWYLWRHLDPLPVHY